jgi:hypothetical protein
VSLDPRFFKVFLPTVGFLPFFGALSAALRFRAVTGTATADPPALETKLSQLWLRTTPCAARGKRRAPLPLRSDDAKAVRGGAIDTFLKTGEIKGSSSDSARLR